MAAVGVSAQTVIDETAPENPVYRQHQELVAEYYRAQASGATPPPLVLFEYVPKHDESLFELASRFMLPYSAIATLNRLDSPALPGGAILIPSIPGVFTFSDYRTSLERRLRDRVNMQVDGTPVRLPNGADSGVTFHPGLDFSPGERDLFLSIRFATPIGVGETSSVFGYRNHPITGIWSFHGGHDIAADFGTPVTSAADGVVTSIERDPWLGLSVHVEHRAGFSTVYAHLQEALVTVGDPVLQGALVGRVGSTGMSTGPHLHFEVRYRGERRNPAEYIDWE
jgi:murein DD-endopeptidase MepM/ murein hydrolase activator NlpD